MVVCLSFHNLTQVEYMWR